MQRNGWMGNVTHRYIVSCNFDVSLIYNTSVTVLLYINK